MWPLPGLVLLDWALLGLLGMAGVALAGRGHPYRGAGAAWAASGGLLPLMILGGFSIGPVVALSELAILGAAILIFVRSRRGIIPSLGVFTAGAIANLTVLFLLISLR